MEMPDRLTDILNENGGPLRPSDIDATVTVLSTSSIRHLV